MKTKAVRLYGKQDLRLEEFELSQITEGEILVKIISDSLCMSSYKAAGQGAEHKRVPNDVAQNPIIIGHEFCGEIVEVGKKWQDEFAAGEKFIIQPAFNYKGSLDAPGYSYRYCGGDATYVIIPEEAMLTGSLLKYSGDAYFYGSLAEPVSCVIGGMHAFYHTTQGAYEHKMGIATGGNMAILAGAGPMGLGAIDYAICCDRKPGLLVVTDIDDSRLDKARGFYQSKARENEVNLYFINTTSADAEAEMMTLTDGEGYNDVLVMAPVKSVVEQADRLLAKDGCLNFFAGPTDHTFSASLNFYNVHYAFTHITGTSGGNTNDMKEAVDLMSRGIINPAAMITHIGGLNCIVNTTLNLPKIPGGKKLIYTHVDMPLFAIDDLPEMGRTSGFYRALADIVANHGGLWNAEAEKFVLSNSPD